MRVKNEKSRVTCNCVVENYPWRIHASPRPDGITFKIKSYVGTHTCVRMSTNSEANSTWIAKKVRRKLRDNPEMKLDAMQAILQNKFGVDAHKMQLYRAKVRVLDEMEGNHGESYSMLRLYGKQIIKSNPGSIVKL